MKCLPILFLVITSSVFATLEDGKLDTIYLDELSLKRAREIMRPLVEAVGPRKLKILREMAPDLWNTDCGDSDPVHYLAYQLVSGEVQRAGDPRIMTRCTGWTIGFQAKNQKLIIDFNANGTILLNYSCLDKWPVDSRKVQALGLGLIILTSMAILNHVWQRFIMMNHKLAIFVDMHTMDELSWLSISLATGVLTILSSRGNQIIQSSSFILSGATIYPSFFYAWLDYRAMTSTHSKFLFNQALFSSMIALPHIGVLLSTFLLFTISLRETVQVRLETIHKIIFAAFSLFFLIVAVCLVDISFYAIFTKQFYRIFHSSEQKLPFLAAFLSLFTGLSIFTKFNFITISASVVVGILALNSTYLHIFSYFYLRWNGYFIDVTNLEFLLLPADKYENGTETSMVHTIETSINVLSLIASFSLVAFLMFLCRTHVTPSEIVDDVDTHTQTPAHERRVLVLGVSMLFGALIVSSLAFFVFLTSDHVHPLVTIYSQIFQIVLGLSITTFALFQVLVAEHLSRYPLFQCSLMFLSIVRALDILTQIDYKDVGTQPIVWSIHALIEYLSIFAHFLTIAQLLYIQGPGRPLIEPAEIPLSFENPLSDQNGTGDENGYVMLQTNENMVIIEE